MDLYVYGYNHKISTLIQKIVTTMKSLIIRPDRFKAIKEALIRQYQNWSMEQPYSHAMYYISFITQESLWSSKEKLEAIEGYYFSSHFFVILNEVDRCIS
jgi:insulysin